MSKQKYCPLRPKTEPTYGECNEVIRTETSFQLCIKEGCEWWEFITGTCAVRTQAYLTAHDRPRER